MVDFISVFGIFISILLLVFLKPHNKSNLYLSGFFFSMGSLALIRNSILYLQNETILQIFVPGLMPVFITSAPFLYLYIRSCVSPEGFRPLKGIDYLHFLPSIILFINFIPHYMQNDAQKTIFIQNLLRDPLTILEVKSLIYPLKYNFLIRPIAGLIYLYFTFKLLLDAKSVAHLLKKLKTDSSYKWYTSLTILTGATHVLVSALSLFFWNTNFNSELLDTYKAYMAVPAFVTLLLNVSILFFPTVIYGIFVDDLEDEQQESVSPMYATKFKGGANVEVDFKEIADQLNEYFQGKSYLKPGFNLSVITKETQIPYHKLTNYFTMYLGVNFNDWKNDIRIAHAVDLIDNGRAKNLTLESIAYSCGYLSRSNFVNAFRKKMGMTPSEYVKSIPEISLVTSAEF
jgi:AraC-like DNA-binding protein